MRSIQMLAINMNSSRLTKITLFLVLLTAIGNYGVWTMPFRSMGHEGFWHPASVAFQGLAILFLASPLLSLLFYMKQSSATYFLLGVFAIPAFMFGYTPIPFGHHFYTKNVHLNTVLIAIVNLGLVFFAIRRLRLLGRRKTAPFSATLCTSATQSVAQVA